MCPDPANPVRFAPTVPMLIPMVRPAVPASVGAFVAVDESSPRQAAVTSIVTVCPVLGKE